MNGSSKLRNLERFSLAMRPKIVDYADLVLESRVADTGALVVFGAVLTDEFAAGRDLVRSILVVERVELEALRRLAGFGARLGKSGIAAPWVLTAKQIENSRDTFPLELIEIQQLHATLLGPERFAELTFEPTHVRLQCERELRRLLINMRQGLLRTAGRERLVPDLEREAVEALLRTLRGLLWLRGRREFLPTAAVLSEVERLTERSLGGVRRAVEHSSHAGWVQFDQLYEDVEVLGELANAW